MTTFYYTLYKSNIVTLYLYDDTNEILWWKKYALTKQNKSKTYANLNFPLQVALICLFFSNINISLFAHCTSSVEYKKVQFATLFDSI